MDPRNDTEVNLIDTALTWYNISEMVGLLESEVILKHDRIRRCFSHVKDMAGLREILQLNDRMKAVLLSAIRRESFEMWEVHATWAEKIDLRPYMRLHAWKNAMDMSFIPPEVLGKKPSDQTPGLGLDVSSPEYEYSYLAADKPLPLRTMTFNSYLAPDWAQDLANDDSLKKLHEEYDKDICHVPQGKDLSVIKHIGQDPVAQKAFLNEYVPGNVWNTSPPSTTLQLSNSSSDGSIRPRKRITSMRKASKRGPSLANDVRLVNYGDLFGVGTEHQFKCLKDDLGSEVKGHHKKILLKGRSPAEYLCDAKRTFKQSKDIDDDFPKALVEFSAFCMSRRMDNDILNTTMNKKGQKKEFFDNDEYFEHLGMEYLKHAKLAVVVVIPGTMEEIIMNYDLFRRYRDDLIEKSPRFKSKYICFNNCPGFQRCIEGEIRDHYEIQLVGAFICTIDGCGQQLSKSKNFGSHVSKVHIRGNLELRIRIVKRCREMQDQSARSVFAGLDQRCFFGGQSFEVEAQYAPPMLRDFRKENQVIIGSITNSTVDMSSEESAASTASPVFRKGSRTRQRVKIEDESDEDEPDKEVSNVDNEDV